MSNILNFDFNSNEIRVISTNPNNPLFVAFDVATALGYSKPRNAVARFCKDKTTAPKQGGGYFDVIGEPDLYRLIFGSKLKSAVKFQDWVFEEVLPTIRKTGKYEKPNPRAKFLSEEQVGHIYQTVMSLCKGKYEFAYRAYFGQLKKHFQVNSYKNILKTDYVAACHFLGVKPKQKLIEQTNQMKVHDIDCEELKNQVVYSASWNNVAIHRWNELEKLTSQLHEIAKKIGYVKSNLFDPIFEQQLFKYVDKDFASRVIAMQNNNRH